MQTPQSTTLNDTPPLPNNASNGLPVSSPAPVTLAPAPVSQVATVAPPPPPPPVPVVASGIAIPVHAHSVITPTNNGGTKPRPRNKMGRRPSWSEAEVLAAVQALLEHPEGLTRGAEAQAAWHQQLRSAFMARFRQQAATNPALAAREDVWANRSARKIISEARAALAACRVAHAERSHLPPPSHTSQLRLPSLHHGTNNSEEFAYPAVYDWLLRCTSELTRFADDGGGASPSIGAGAGGGAGAGAGPTVSSGAVTVAIDDNDATHIVPSGAMGNGIAVAVTGQNTGGSTGVSGGVGVATTGVGGGGNGGGGGVLSVGTSMAGVTNATGMPSVPRTRAPKRPRSIDGQEELTARLAAMDTETRRQNSELAVLRELFTSGAPASEVEEFKRLLRRNALRRARIEVEDLPRGTP